LAHSLLDERLRNAGVVAGAPSFDCALKEFVVMVHRNLHALVGDVAAAGAAIWRLYRQIMIT